MIVAFKDGPRLILCATWPHRPAGYNKNIPIPHIKAVPEPLWCAELECYCCTSWPARSSCAQYQLRTVLKPSLGCFRKTRRKHGIRENQSTATVPVLKRPPDQFAVSQLLDGNVRVYARLGRARGRPTRALIGWLPFRTLSTPYVNWPSNVAYFSGTREFSELRRPPAEISGLSFLRHACENSLLSTEKREHS